MRIASLQQPRCRRDSRRMTIPERLRYALYLTVITGAGIALVLILLTVVGWVRAPAIDFIFSPVFVVPLYFLTYLFAPWASQRFPIARRR